MARTAPATIDFDADIKAAELMGNLHDRLKVTGYGGHQLEVYLVRMLFCLFAEDTGIFVKDAFLSYLHNRTQSDGSDVALHIHKIFETLNTPEQSRSTNLDDQLRDFPYVNGKLFEEPIPIPSFDEKMRETLIECAEFDWSQISPAIFGAMFQSVMNPQERRNLGAHYTSEANIFKLIRPLFLDDLQAEFNKIAALQTKNLRKERLAAFHDKLASLKFLDPACGCGNFLIVTYRELRELEIEVIKVLRRGEAFLTVNQLVRVDVHQFYGIEIEEFPSLIAQTALWLIDHQMNNKVRATFGNLPSRIPLITSPFIRCADALQADWETVIPKTELSYIFGNPPFVGARLMDSRQKSDLETVFAGVKSSGNLDYVTCWYKKAAEYIQGTNIECAFVSTNSICQGEQVPALWRVLCDHYGIKINFAHQTFKWSNDARGKAAVFCVIVGFSTTDLSEKKLFLYDTVTSEPRVAIARQINAYLIDAPNVVVTNRSMPLCEAAPMVFGNQPIDAGHFLLDAVERKALLKTCPEATQFVRPYVGAEEFINNSKRFCIWLKGVSPQEYRHCKPIIDRVEAVRRSRLESKRAVTRELANTATEFAFISHPDKSYLLIPSVSSEKRSYIPMGFMSEKTIASNACLIIPNATLYEFGVLTSTMHMAWTRYVCGRLEMRYRYSASIVYNNFPWCEPTEKQRAAIADAAQAVLDAREQFPESSLADLYDPNTMPRVLLKTHEKLDRLVEKAYGRDFTDDAARVAFLFERYQSLTADLITEPTQCKTRCKRKTAKRAKRK